MAAMMFACPHCRMALTLDEEYAGRPVPCPGCGNAFVAPAPAIPAYAPPVPEYAPAPAPASSPPPAEPLADAMAGLEKAAHARSADAAHAGGGGTYSLRSTAGLAPGWETVRAGISVLMAGYGLAAAAMLLLFIAVVKMLNGLVDMQAAMTVGKMFLLALYSTLVATVIVIVGISLCGAAPRDSGVKGPATAAAVLQVIDTGFGALVMFDIIRGAEWVFWVLLAVSAAAQMLALFAIKGAADRFGGRLSSAVMINIAAALIVDIAALAFLLVLRNASGRPGPGTVGFAKYMLYALPAAECIYLVWTVLLIGSVRNVVQSGGPRGNPLRPAY